MKKLRDDLDFSRTYGSVPDSFKERVQDALREKEEEKAMKRPIFRTVAIVLVLLTFTTAACAAVLSRTSEYFDWLYGANLTDDLSSGELVISGETHQVGDVVYTLDDAIWTNNGLYAVITARAAEGANIVLMAEDYETTDPAGYLVYYGRDEEIPENAPSYRDLAEASSAKLVQARAIFENAIDPNNTEINGDSGVSDLPQTDGSIVFAIEFGPEEGVMEQLRSGECQVNIFLSVVEKTLDGDFIDETRIRDNWIVTLIPEG